MKKASKKVGRGQELFVKAIHLILRQIQMTPEMIRARKLSKKFSKVPTSETTSSMSGERILVATMRDWAVHVHFEAILGQALKSAGAEVSHITCGGGLQICDRVNTWEGPPMPCDSCAKYVKSSLKAHGANFSSLSDQWGSAIWPELDNMNLDDLRNVNYKDLPLGALVEIPVKWFLLGEALDQDPLGTSTYRMFLKSARAITDSMESVINNFQPTQVLMLNGLFLFESIIWNICRLKNISVVTYERAFIIDTFVFSRDDAAGFYKMKDVWELWSHQDLSVEEEKKLDQYIGERQLGLRMSDDYWRQVTDGKILRSRTGRRAVLFTNLVWDSAVVGQDLAFKSIVDWVVAAIEEFRGRPNDELIIRIHPAETKLSGRESRESIETAVRNRVENLPENLIIIPSSDSTSSYDLMYEADFGLVYSSTTGLEMVLTGKPVVVAAETHYRGKGFTIDIDSSADFSQAIEQLCLDPLSYTPNKELVRRYAYLFFFRAPFVNMGVTEPIRGLVSLNVDDPKSHVNADQSDMQRFLAAMLSGSSFNPNSTSQV